MDIDAYAKDPAQSYTVYVKPNEIEELYKALNYGEMHIYQK